MLMNALSYGLSDCKSSNVSNPGSLLVQGQLLPGLDHSHFHSWHPNILEILGLFTKPIHELLGHLQVQVVKLHTNFP